MLTGLLYVAVIGMWAVVLLPRWLGTSDRYRDARSTQRFRRSLHAVSVRRHRSHDMAAKPGSMASRVDTAPADAAIDAHLDHGIDPFVGMPEDKHRRRARAEQVRKQATAVAAGRRRRVLIALGSATVLSLVAAVLGFLPVTLAVISAGALGGYVYLLRSQSRARSRAAAQRRRRAGEAQNAAPAEQAEQTWDPVEAPIPSYMRAAKATAIPREIDSTKNGPWTAERMLEQAAALRAGEDAESELGLDEYAYPEYQHARAVNE